MQKLHTETMNTFSGILLIQFFTPNRSSSSHRIKMYTESILALLQQLYKIVYWVLSGGEKPTLFGMHLSWWAGYKKNIYIIDSDS